MCPITGPNLVIPLKSYFRFSLILLENNVEKMTVTDGTPLKMYTKWEILKYLFLVSKCFIFTSSQTNVVFIDWET